jgi:hypothetical protein
MRNDFIDVLTEDPAAQRFFTIAARRVSRIHKDITNIELPIISWWHAPVAIVCLLLGWYRHSYLIGIVAFIAYVLLDLIIRSLRRVHILGVLVHQQLIYLATQRHDLDRETLGYMEYVLREYSADKGFHDLSNEHALQQCRYAFTKMLEARLREEGLSDPWIGNELDRYHMTVDPDSRRGGGQLKNPEGYTDEDF